MAEIYGGGDKQRIPCRGQIFKGMGDAEVLAHMNAPREHAQHKPGWYHNPGPEVPASMYEHANVLGAGAKKRRKLHGQKKVGAVMHEWKAGTLHSGSGAIVTSRPQAIAIGLAEAGMSKKKKRRK